MFLQVDYQVDSASSGNSSVISGLTVLPWLDDDKRNPRTDSHGTAQDSSSASIFDFLSTEDAKSTANTTSASGSGMTTKVVGSELFMNDYFTLRGKVDLFGRNISDLRKSMTKNDTEPFATL